MNALEDAYRWYRLTRRNLELLQRLARKHWKDFPWTTGPIGRDDDFKNLEPLDIENETEASLERIDDLGVVILFSAFESIVRSHVVDLIEPEASGLSQPILKAAAKDAISGVKVGSFYRRVLEPLKKQKHISADLITQVDQVRDYRNRVAHGSRGRPKNNVDPKMAYQRLKEFLDVLGITSEAEPAAPEVGGEEQEGIQ